MTDSIAGLAGAVQMRTDNTRFMASRIGHGTVRTTMEIYARATDYADRQAADLLQVPFGPAFGEGPVASDFRRQGLHEDRAAAWTPHRLGLIPGRASCFAW